MRRAMTLSRAMHRVERIPIAGCWLWMGNVKGGYGVVIIGGTKERPRQTGAHRFFYERLVGPIPEGMDVLHRCDVPSCVNVNHLFLGTQRDNNADKVAKKRHRWGTSPGESHGHSRLTAAQVRAMRTMRSKGARLAEIGQQFGIAVPHVHRIVNRLAWKHLD